MYNIFIRLQTYMVILKYPKRIFDLMLYFRRIIVFQENGYSDIQNTGTPCA